MDTINEAAARGLSITTQIAARPVGLLLGLELSRNPFQTHPSYREIARLPLAERLKHLRRPEVRAAILTDTTQTLGFAPTQDHAVRTALLPNITALGAAIGGEWAGAHLHLVAGNHDSVHPLHRRAHRKLDDYLRVFQTVQPFARRRVEGHDVWLSHFPWHGGGDHTAVDRYSTVRLNDDGVSWLLHGHTHSLARVDLNRRMIQVGVDAWDLAPVSLHTITDMLRRYA